MMTMRELEMSTAAPEWQYPHCSYEFTNGFFMGMVGAEAKVGSAGFTTNTTANPVNLDEKVKLKEQFVVPAFGTLVLHGQMEWTMILDHTLWVITQAPNLKIKPTCPTDCMC